MIIVNLKGGLGNQLFQYACGKAVALKTNRKLKVDISSYKFDTKRTYSLSVFNANIEIITKKEKNRFMKKEKSLFNRFFKRYHYIKEEALAKFYEEIFKLQGHLFLDGYWQSEKYFFDVKEIIQKDLGFKIKNKNLFNTNKNKIKIAVHIRRGDYVLDKKTNEYHGICSLEYYKNAIDLIHKKLGNQNTVFCVFSDDMAWVKENFTFLTNVFFVDFTKYDYEDLYLMSQCDHFIIANSTFSWWGAWLSKNKSKMVVAPKKWFNIEKDSTNLIPTTWIKL